MPLFICIAGHGDEQESLFLQLQVMCTSVGCAILVVMLHSFPSVGSTFIFCASESY